MINVLKIRCGLIPSLPVGSLLTSIAPAGDGTVQWSVIFALGRDVNGAGDFALDVVLELEDGDVVRVTLLYIRNEVWMLPLWKKEFVSL